jgi:hypothetical protein
MSAAGQQDASKVVKDVVEGSPSKPARYLESIKRDKPNCLSANEAPSLLIECKLSKSQYNYIRSISLEKKRECVVKTHDRSETFVLLGNQNIVNYH